MITVRCVHIHIYDVLSLVCMYSVTITIIVNKMYRLAYRVLRLVAFVIFLQLDYGAITFLSASSDRFIINAKNLSLQEYICYILLEIILLHLLQLPRK